MAQHKPFSLLLLLWSVCCVLLGGRENPAALEVSSASEWEAITKKIVGQHFAMDIFLTQDISFIQKQGSLRPLGYDGGT